MPSTPHTSASSTHAVERLSRAARFRGISALKISSKESKRVPLNQYSVAMHRHLEYRQARSLNADLTVKRILETVVSIVVAGVFLVSAVVLMTVLGQVGAINLPLALLIAMPLYLAGFSRLMVAFGIDFSE